MYVNFLYIYFVNFLQFNPTIQTPLHDFIPFRSTPLHSALPHAEKILVQYTYNGKKPKQYMSM